MRIWIGAVLVLAACSEPDALDDDPLRYIGEVAYRRAILERDLTTADNQYAQDRLANYGVAGEGWEALPERDPATTPFTLSAAAARERGAPLALDDAAAETLVPADMPASDAAWIALGRRVFFEFPLRLSPELSALSAIPGGLAQTGFLEEDGAYVGVRVARSDGGEPALAGSCAQCHASRLPDGSVEAVLANRAMDVGLVRLLVLDTEPSAIAFEIDATDEDDLAALGPGRSDVMVDGVFNPFVFGDLGGIADLPYLQHNANWHNRGAATLAVRCETLFITASRETRRIPRVLAWALARYLRSLPPPPPAGERTAEAELGESVFAAAGCPDCHTPPLYSSARLVGVGEVGTDAAAGESIVRRTGHYRIPSLRGVGRTAPYLHHGAVATLEALFDPSRAEPGHPFGLALPADDRLALLAFLRSL